MLPLLLVSFDWLAREKNWKEREKERERGRKEGRRGGRKEGRAHCHSFNLNHFFFLFWNLLAFYLYPSVLKFQIMCLSVVSCPSPFCAFSRPL